MLGATRAFCRRHPDCDVHIAETSLSDPFGQIRRGEIDLLFVCLPVDEPDLTVGPVVLREARTLGVPAGHPLVSAVPVPAEALADYALIDIAEPAPRYWRDVLTPPVTPAGHPIARGPAASTLQEALSMVAAGRGLMPFPALIETYHGRPDIAFLPIEGLPATRLALVRRASDGTARTAAFIDAAASSGPDAAPRRRRP